MPTGALRLLDNTARHDTVTGNATVLCNVKTITRDELKMIVSSLLSLPIIKTELLYTGIEEGMLDMPAVKPGTIVVFRSSSPFLMLKKPSATRVSFAT
jgi:hypothetical protein